MGELKMRALELITISVVLYVILPFTLTQGRIQERWLKVITRDGHEFSVTSKQCRGGIWTPKSINVSCICVNGMWVISRKFCDDDFEIILGENHCFPINRQIRKFSYIGTYWTEPDWFGNYFFRSDMPYVARFNKNSEFRIEDSIKYVLRVNMRNSLLARYQNEDGMSQELCISETQKGPAQGSASSVGIYLVDGHNTFQAKSSDACLNMKKLSPLVLMRPGQSWRPKKSHEIRESTSMYPTCKPSKLISRLGSTTNKPPAKRTMDFNTKVPRIDPLLDFLRPRMSPVLDFRREDVQRILETTREVPKRDKMRATRRQTTRKPAVRLNKPNQLVWTPAKAKTKKVEETTQGGGEDEDSDPYWDGDLPPEEKNQLIFEQTKRILKMHIRFLTHQKRIKLIGKEEYIYLRIAKNVVLRMCPDAEVPKPLLNSVLRLFRYALYESIEVYPYTELTDKEADSRISNSLISCYISASKLEFKHKKGSCSQDSRVIEGVLHEGVEYNATLPKSLSFNNTLDFVVEGIWKIMLLAQYYCAKDFGTNPADLSMLMVKWEAFFSPILRYRWANPGRSWNLFKAVFQQYNLETFVTGIDKCAAIAKECSHYPVWIERPILRKDKMKKHMRRKRSRKEAEPDHWNRKGFCLQNFFDPFRKFSASAPSSCLKELNGEHDF